MSNRGKIIIGVLLAGAVIALLAFRKKKGVDQTSGDDETVTSEPTTTSTSKGFPLKYGSRGNNVKSLQRFLNYSDASYQLKVNGVFGNLTQAAVEVELGKKIVHKDYFDTFISGKF